ncbi:MAG: alpha/beta fold hydrolase [Planctomycetaceae bacterium]|nr:alpha/beta fold hydrolase [Planctomycetaceae bacterium]
MRLLTSTRSAAVSLFIVASALIYGLSMLLCASPVEAAYFAAVPIFLAHALLLRRHVVTGLSRRHAIYFAIYVVLLLALVAAYQAAFVYVTPSAAARWQDMAAAAYFVAAIHIIIWSLDRACRTVMRRLMGISGLVTAARWRRACVLAARVAVVLLIAAPLATAALTTHWIRFADSTDPQALCGANFARAGFYTDDGIVVRGWYMPADDASSNAAVIVVPGRGMGKATLIPYARMLGEQGFNVLLMDLRGEGASEGYSRGFGVVESRDVLAALRYLKQAHPRHSTHVLAVGISQGAAAVLAAAKADTRIEALAVDSLYPSPRAELDSILAWLPGPARRYVCGATLAMASLQAGDNLLDESAATDMAAMAGRALLMIHSDQDANVPIAQARTLYASANHPAMFWKVSGAAHGDAVYARPGEHAAVVCKTFKSVRAGLDPFGWAGRIGG